MVEAIGHALDAAIFFGVNKPASWPSDIVTSATASANAVLEGAATAAQGGIVGDISNAMALVEGDGYDCNGIVAHRKYRGLLRNARSTTGEQLGATEAGTEVQAAPGTVYGIDITYPLRGLWPTGAGAAELITGDFTEGLLGIRQDITFKVLDQAVITDNTGAVIYNLPQQDMLAMRVVARFAFEVRGTPQPENVANAYPFGIIHGA